MKPLGKEESVRVCETEMAGTELALEEKAQVSVYRAALLLACCHIPSLHSEGLFP